MNIKTFEQFNYAGNHYNDVEVITFDEFNENTSYDSIEIGNEIKNGILNVLSKYDRYFDVMDKHYHGMDDNDNSLVYMNPDSPEGFYYTEVQVWQNADSELFLSIQIKEPSIDDYYRIDIGFGTEEVFKLLDDTLFNSRYHKPPTFGKSDDLF